MAETVFRILKISVIVTICSVFMVAILNISLNIVGLVFGNFVGEFFAFISMYMPFQADIVFVGFSAAISAILSFLIAKKIFDLTSWSISTV